MISEAGQFRCKACASGSVSNAERTFCVSGSRGLPSWVLSIFLVLVMTVSTADVCATAIGYQWDAQSEDKTSPIKPWTAVSSELATAHYKDKDVSKFASSVFSFSRFMFSNRVVILSLTLVCLAFSAFFALISLTPIATDANVYIVAVAISANGFLRIVMSIYKFMTELGAFQHIDKGVTSGYELFLLFGVPLILDLGGGLVIVVGGLVRLFGTQSPISDIALLVLFSLYFVIYTYYLFQNVHHAGLVRLGKGNALLTTGVLISFVFIMMLLPPALVIHTRSAPSKDSLIPSDVGILSFTGSLFSLLLFGLIILLTSLRKMFVSDRADAAYSSEKFLLKLDRLIRTITEYQRLSTCDSGTFYPNSTPEERGREHAKARSQLINEAIRATYDEADHNAEYNCASLTNVLPESVRTTVVDGKFCVVFEKDDSTDMCLAASHIKNEATRLKMVSNTQRGYASIEPNMKFLLPVALVSSIYLASIGGIVAGSSSFNVSYDEMATYMRALGLVSAMMVSAFAAFTIHRLESVADASSPKKA